MQSCMCGASRKEEAHRPAVALWKCKSFRPRRTSSLNSPLFYFYCSTFRIFSFLLCGAQLRMPLCEVASHRKLLSQNRDPHQAHLLSPHHFPLTEPFSHTLTLKLAVNNQMLLENHLLYCTTTRATHLKRTGRNVF